MGVFSSRDRGWNALLTSFRVNAGESAAFVGYLRSSGMHNKSQKDSSEPKQPVTVAQIAAINEYGSSDGRVPERSFIRSAMAEHGKKLDTLCKKAVVAIVDGRTTKKKALGVIAQKATDWIKGKIDEGVPPPNAPSTIAAKGSDHPLVDTGQLRNSLDWEIQEGRRVK